jgi:hypothetical protein
MMRHRIDAFVKNTGINWNKTDAHSRLFGRRCPVIYANRYTLYVRGRLPLISPKPRPDLAAGFFLFTVLAVGILCAACSRGDDAKQIQARIAKGAALAEAHEIGDLLQLATKNIRAMPMNLKRSEIRGVLWRTFRYYEAFAILYPRPAIALAENGREAQTEFPFLIVKKEGRIPGLEKLRDDPAGWLEAVGENADLYHLRLEWIKQDGHWLVELAVLERFGRMGF